jgi:hypothetical protein
MEIEPGFLQGNHRDANLAGDRSKAAFPSLDYGSRDAKMFGDGILGTDLFSQFGIVFVGRTHGKECQRLSKLARFFKTTIRKEGKLNGFRK